MPTPLQERVYELLVRTGSAEIDRHDWRIERISRLLFRDAADLGSALERALGGADRSHFSSHLYEANTLTRQIKLWVRLLDDLGAVQPEHVAPIHALAEEIHALVLSALRTAKASTNGVPS